MLRRLSILLVALLVLAVPTAVAAGGSPAAVGAAHRRAAVAAADGLLNEVVLPAGSTRVGSEPAGSGYQLDHSYAVIWLADVVDKTAFWVTAASPETVISTAQAHPPAGWHSSGQATINSLLLTALGPRRESQIRPRGIFLSTVTLTNGSTGVRADALVAYTTPRPPAQRVPSGARVLEVTRGVLGARPSVHLTITRARVIRRIAAAVDALPFAGPPGVAVNCPAMTTTPDLVTFTFRASGGGPVLARLSEAASTPRTPGPCAPITFTVRGRDVPGLTAGGRVLRIAGALLGVRLASS